MKKLFLGVMLALSALGLYGAAGSIENDPRYKRHVYLDNLRITSPSEFGPALAAEHKALEKALLKSYDKSEATSDRNFFEEQLERYEALDAQIKSSSAGVGPDLAAEYAKLKGYLQENAKKAREYKAVAERGGTLKGLAQRSLPGYLPELERLGF